MAFLYRFNKPEYLFRPKQLLKRLTSNSYYDSSSLTAVELPWGQTINVNPTEVVGRSIEVLGVYELAQTEILRRSLKFAKSFIDIGANIGYFTLAALGSKNFDGKILSFEPHPSVIERLKENVRLQNKNNNVEIYDFALSESEGSSMLYIPEDFSHNEGIATLEKPLGKHREIMIKHKRLDELIPDNDELILKIDTEGHEFSVLKGAAKLFEKGSVKAVFFEEFSHPSKASSFEFLKSFGFKVFRIERSLFGPKLVDPLSPLPSKIWEPTNYLAIYNESIPVLELTAKGWSCLR
ncbi:MAG: hypothetical protein COW01_01610 [Bdellovibrionales bacterium CG12_big_fil_rev_8_21_14_0_65_38_15]|nr:MAG: hypothetical protein COW79_00160 [Bdellovibrionales bacterium CG22_combo_CG10-13_8_21_14_all_38_13]PIQ57168.1 MAG: hypothetical protein COW01_01610 [Bdellovibrionales bacterium CG12_big_fil_rev_8_21_14_0_65_38_15]PIR31362.1 MAG: hypothetical protein COV38_00700 [Bdellovibrionales bacterium CG11_big_fil_rev_8_21_14_0_20_38_13]